MNNEEIYFAKVKPTAIIPSKREEDGGYDIYANFEEEYIAIMPHETKMIFTGIASAFSDDYVMILKERGSTGTKGIAQRCGVIDSGFRNEWKIPITNTTEKVLIISKLSREGWFGKYSDIVQKFDSYNFDMNTYAYIFYPYEKAIAQALLIPVPKVIINEVSYEYLQKFISERGEGMLGSSGK